MQESPDDFPSNIQLRGRIKMRYLLLLVAIDDVRSVHKAAEVMSISQPAATKLLGELERMVGVKLFSRTTRGLTPNHYGESLIRHARSIVASVDVAWTELDELRAGAAGKVNVGAIVAAEALLLPRAINRLKQRHPRLAVSIVAGTFDSLVPELRAGRLDLILARTSEDRHGAGLRYESLFDEPMALVGRKHHPLMESGDFSLASLAKFPWIWPPMGSIYRSRVAAMFRQDGIDPPSDLVESECTLANKTLIQESDRIGALPLTIAQSFAHEDSIVVMPYSLPAPSGKLGIIQPSDRTISPSTSALVDALRETARDMTGTHE